MAAKKGLGTGLDVLFGESAKDEEQKELVQSLPASFFPFTSAFG